MNFTPEMQQVFFLGGAVGILVLIFIEWVDRKWPH